MEEYLEDINIENFVDPPTPSLQNGEKIVKYMKLKSNPEILIPMIIDSENKIKYPIFFCSKCNKWLRISTTISNIFSHIKRSHNKVIQESRNIVVENNKNGMENNIKNIIYHLKAFIILNGYPFSTIEDEDLNAICELQSRTSLVRSIEELSKLTQQKIRIILESASIISIAVDEWQDRAKRRYLGVTASSIIERQYRIFTLAHRPMVEEHCKAGIIRKYLLQILNEYNITRKIKCAVTDNGGAIPSAFSYDPNDENNLNIKRFPCICHVINIYAKTFQNNMKNDLNEFIRIKNLFDIPGFVAYLNSSDSNRKKISSFTEIRWSSLFFMIDDMLELKKEMIRYNELNKLGNIDDSVWENLVHWHKVFKIFVRCIKAVEGNEFGLISKSLPCIRRIQQVLRSLPQRFAGAILEVNQKIDTHWIKYEDNWTPILHVCSRLNPYINHQKILTKNELELADRTIKMLMSRKQIRIQNQKETSDDDFDFMRHGNSSDSKDIFNEYLVSLIGFSGEENLLKYWMDKLDTNWRPLAEIALDFLSIPSSSATAERQFSRTRISIGMSRLKLSEDHIEDSAILLMNEKIARPLFESMIKR